MRERAVFVEHDQLAVGVEQLRAREGAVLPRDGAGLDVDGGEKRRARNRRSTCTPVSPIRMMRADVHAHAVDRPPLRDGGLARGLAQLERAAAGAVRRREQQQVIRRRPHRRADVEAPVGAMRMAPQFACRSPDRGRRCDRRRTARPASGRRHRSRSATPVSSRRCRAFHNSAPVSGLKAPSAWPALADRQEDGVVEQQRAVRHAAIDVRRAVLLDQIVRPQHLAGVLVERDELAARCRRRRAGCRRSAAWHADRRLR